MPTRRPVRACREQCELDHKRRGNSMDRRGCREMADDGAAYLAAILVDARQVHVGRGERHQQGEGNCRQRRNERT